MAAKAKTAAPRHRHYGLIEPVDRPAPEGKLWAKCPDGQVRLLSENLIER